MYHNLKNAYATPKKTFSMQTAMSNDSLIRSCLLLSLILLYLINKITHIFLFQNKLEETVYSCVVHTLVNLMCPALAVVK